MRKYIIISTSNDLLRIAQDKVVYILARRELYYADPVGWRCTVDDFPVGTSREADSGSVRLGWQCVYPYGKCLIVNRNYIYYINVSKQQLILSDNNNSKLTVSASKEALKQLKELLEREKIEKFMKEHKDIREDEIRVIGGRSSRSVQTASAEMADCGPLCRCGSVRIAFAVPYSAGTASRSPISRRKIFRPSS